MAFPVLIAVLIFTSHCDSAKILGLFISPFSSSNIIHTALIDTLVDHGHEATVITALPLKNKKGNFRHIQLNISCVSPEFMAQNMKSSSSLFASVVQLVLQAIECCNTTLSNLAMRQVMEEESFDLVIMGHMFNDIQLGVAAHFNCPVIILCPTQLHLITKRIIGNPVEIAYVPHLLVPNAVQPMNFWARVENYAFHVLSDVFLYFFSFRENEIYNYHFPPDRYPTYDEIKQNVSLVLANYHFSQGIISSNMPGVVEIGGIHLKDKLDPLPEDVQIILDNAKDGAIYVSFGSTALGSLLNKATTKIMFDVLSKLDQKVLWKWDDQDMPGRSPNIIYKSWFQQSEILAHPNVKLFITHGGMGSVLESKFYGVPMVGVPVLTDQFANIGGMVSDGYGLGIGFDSITFTSFNETVFEVLFENRYSENVKRFAKIYNDRPMSAKKTAVFWVEYVLRHRGAPHIQSPLLHMNSLQVSSVDVIAFLLFVFYVVLKIIKTFLMLFYVKVVRDKVKDE